MASGDVLEYLSGLDNKRVGRRGLFAVALGGALAGCGGREPPASVLPPISGPPEPPKTGVAAVADKFDTIAKAIDGILPKLGLDGGVLSGVTKLVSDLADLTGKIAASGGGDGTKSLVETAGGIVDKTVSLLQSAGTGSGPYGWLLSAGLSMLPEIFKLAGINKPGRRFAARVPMIPPHQAETMLRLAARKPA